MDIKDILNIEYVKYLIEDSISRYNLKPIFEQKAIKINIKNIKNIFKKKQDFDIYKNKNVYVHQPNDVTNKFMVVYLNTITFEELYLVEIFLKMISEFFKYINELEIINLVDKKKNIRDVINKYTINDVKLTRQDYINISSSCLMPNQKINLDKLYELYGDKLYIYINNKEYYTEKYKDDIEEIMLNIQKNISI